MSRTRNKRHSTSEILGYSKEYERCKATGIRCPTDKAFRWRKRKTRPFGLKLYSGLGGETYSSRYRIEYCEPVIEKGSERMKQRKLIKEIMQTC